MSLCEHGNIFSHCATCYPEYAKRNTPSDKWDLPPAVRVALTRVSDKVMDASLLESDLVELCKLAMQHSTRSESPQRDGLPGEDIIQAGIAALSTPVRETESEIAATDETPITDAAAFQIRMDRDGYEVVPSEDCRRIERQLRSAQSATVPIEWEPISKDEARRLVKEEGAFHISESPLFIRGRKMGREWFKLRAPDLPMDAVDSGAKNG